jgi:hypothetical protein
MAVEYLSKVRQKRGEEAADKLQKDCSEQWAKGSKGDHGKWL